MGSALSAPTVPTNTLLEDHDISPSDVTTAYGKSSPQCAVPLSLPSDTPNTGLHPTHKAGKYLALDCEMVGTGPPPSTDSLLARVSVVNYNYEQIYDSYVLPPPKIRVTDYRTSVSGIQPSHLRPGVARPFAEVAADIADLLKRHGRVLVGHALRNDFAVLGFGHPRRETRDTASWKPFRSNGGAPRLRDLAKRELGLEIQGGEHSSLEDARAAMGLFRKVKREWEEEVRRRFGGPRNGGLGKGKGKGRGKGVAQREAEAGKDEGDQEEDEDEEEEESGEDEGDGFWDLLEGEEDEEEALGAEGVARTSTKTAQGKKKKSKKKKRTKRK